MTNPNATEAEKQTCIDAVLKDTATVTKEIEVLQQEIERVQQTTKDKIVAKPGGGCRCQWYFGHGRIFRHHWMIGSGGHFDIFRRGCWWYGW